MSKNRLYLPGVLVAALLALVAVSPASPAGAGQNQPRINPANFVQRVDNEFFPLRPGTTFFYKGTKDGTPANDVTQVTRRTKKILGVTTTVVRDRAFENGVLVEETFDWYAQDRAGNVWYFGEDARELDAQGKVISREGSWQAGVNGAQAGIVMEAAPRVGDRYNQELAPGVAEDKAQVLSLDRSLCIRFGCFNGVLATREFSPLKPGVVERKYYAEGVGMILAVMVSGGQERSELVGITTD